MKIGLILGKFMPLHNGHLALVDFALQHCDKLYVLVCANDEVEPIPGNLRLQWVKDTLLSYKRIEIFYTNEKIPYTAESSRYISKLWSEYLKTKFPDVSIFFSSEKYGDYVAEYLGIEHKIFDPPRKSVPVSATMIRDKPITYWEYLPQPVKPYFVKKVCICGTESTGKSTLTQRLATYFQTTFVREMAREIPKKSEDYTLADLQELAKLHANEINRQIPLANKILICDTGLDTTKIYSTYFFDTIPVFEKWVEDANQFDLFLFLTNDVNYIDDGTRLPSTKRDQLHTLQFNYFRKKSINLEIISGNWDERMIASIKKIKEHLFDKF